jgi:hypothetical protein
MGLLQLGTLDMEAVLRDGQVLLATSEEVRRRADIKWPDVVAQHLCCASTPDAPVTGV